MRIAGIILIVLSLGVFGYWGASGAHFTTQYKVLEKVTTEDDFGDKVTTEQLVDKFQFGMMPDAGYDGALPIGGGLGGLGFALIVLDIMRRRKEEQG